MQNDRAVTEIFLYKNFIKIGFIALILVKILHRNHLKDIKYFFVEIWMNFWMFEIVDQN